MDFISQNEYKVYYSVDSMYQKHAVWCQCVIMGMFVLTVASILSIQSITFATDIYWSVVFLLTSTTEFIVAEHAPVGHISTTTWVKIGVAQKTVVYAIILTWSIYSGEQSWMQWIHIPTAVVIGFLFQNPLPVLTVATITRMATSPDFSLLLLVLLSSIHFKRPNIINKSMASKEQKQRRAIKAVAILLETIVLWLIRCEHRFPNIVRWKPLGAAALAMILSAIWCEYNVMDTIQSDNVIIVGHGHGMAASQRAAQNCPVCLKQLTSLDMESSFYDTNGPGQQTCHL